MRHYISFYTDFSNFSREIKDASREIKDPSNDVLVMETEESKLFCGNALPMNLMSLL